MWIQSEPNRGEGVMLIGAIATTTVIWTRGSSATRKSTCLSLFGQNRI
jgi:hypothetical protein